jgi:hypothetical protein
MCDGCNFNGATMDKKTHAQLVEKGLALDSITIL